MECQFCHEMKTANNIKAHIKTHLRRLEGVKKHQCPKCSYSSNWAPHLKSHINIKHNVEHQLAKLQRQQNRKKARKAKNDVVEPNVSSIGSEVIDVGTAKENQTQKVEQIDQAIQTDVTEVSDVIASKENVIQIQEVRHNEQAIQTDFNEEGYAAKPSLTSFNIKLDVVKQVLQIHEEAALNASQEALTVHIKLMENLAPLFSDAASIIVQLNEHVEIKLASDNLLATIFRWMKYTNNLRKCL